MIRSVRARTALVAGLGTALAVIAFSALLLVSLRSSLIDEIDRSNDARAADIAARIAETDQITELGFGLAGDTFAAVLLEGELWSATDADVTDEMVAAMFSDLDQPFDASLPALTETEGATNLRGVAVQIFTVFDEEVTAPEGDVAVVASSLDPVDRTLRRVALTLGLGGPILVALATGLVWYLTGRALRPVETIRAQAGSISASDLDQRVPVPDTADEVSRLAGTMNELLERLEQSQRRQQQFVSDASHELRSPLASIAAQLDVDAAHPDRADLSATSQSVRAEVDRLHSMVEDLMLLARSDGGAITQRTDLVDLDDVLLTAAARLVVPPHVTMDVSSVSAGLVSGDAGQLDRVATNLLTNAVRHAESRVAVGLSQSSDGVVCWVDDDGVGIPADERSKVFERFVRLDDARSRERGGSGLGLSISAEIVAAHGGTMAVIDSPLGGSRFVVRLPGA